MYLAPAIVIWLASLWSTRGRALVFGAVCAFLILALRDRIGYDYLQYWGLYEQRLLPREPIAALIAGLSFLANDYRVFFALYAALIIGVAWVGSRDFGENATFANFILLPWFFLESFSILRQSLSLALAFVAYVAIVRGQRRRSIFWIAAAVLTHFSAFPFALAVIGMTFVVRPIVRLLIIPLCAALGSLFLPTIINLVDSPLLPTLAFYRGENAFGLGLVIYSALLLLCSLGDSVRRNERIALVSAGVIASLGAIAVDAVIARVGYFFFIPLLLVDWTRWFGGIRFRFSPIYVGLVTAFLYFVFLRSGLFPGSMVPYKVILF